MRGRTIFIAAVLLMSAAISSSAAPRAFAGSFRPTAVSDPGVLTSATVQIRPDSGPAGTRVAVYGTGFYGCRVSAWFTDAHGTSTTLGNVGGPSFKTRCTIPAGAALGDGAVSAVAYTLDPRWKTCSWLVSSASAAFTVTPRVWAPGVLTSATVQIRPESGPGGTIVAVKGTGFQSLCASVRISFTDADGVYSVLGLAIGPSFKTRVTITGGAAIGAGSLVAENYLHYDPLHHACFGGGTFTQASATFTVTPG